MLITRERRARPSLIGLLLVTVLALLSSCRPGATVQIHLPAGVIPVAACPPGSAFTLSRVITEFDVQEVLPGILAVSIEVRRLSGEVVAGIPTTWTVEVGGGLSEAHARSLVLVTDGAGRAQTMWRLTYAGWNRLRISADSALDRVVRWRLGDPE